MSARRWLWLMISPLAVLGVANATERDNSGGAAAAPTSSVSSAASSGTRAVPASSAASSATRAVPASSAMAPATSVSASSGTRAVPASSGGLTASTRATPPNPVVVPPYRAGIRAAHRLHAEQTQLACIDCHPKALSSRQAGDWLGPSPAICERCHQVDHRTVKWSDLGASHECAKCHLRAPEPRPSSRLLHPHASHARHNIGCPQCHGWIARQPDAIGSERLPRKPSCVRCHAGRGRDDGGAVAHCTACHESEGGRMRTRFQGQRLQPTASTPSLEHGTDWILRHRDVAGNDPARCEGCHAQRECQACHDGRLRPRRIHPGDWLSAHAVAAKQDGLSCMSCHRQQSFCLGCHQRVGLGASGAAAAMARRGAQHPPASVWTTGPLGPRHHGIQARRNLVECVSCHQERDCVRCHARDVRGTSNPHGMQANPHPPGFGANCGQYWAANPRPCLVCHRPDGLELQRCR